MPFKSGRFRRTNRRRFRRPARRRWGAPLRGMRWKRGNRVAQNMSRDVRWFKDVNSIASDGTGECRFDKATRDVINAGDFTNYAINYEEFKILQVTVKFYPAKVGSESAQLPPGQPLFLRGDTVSWIDQRTPDPNPVAIFDVINKSSARLFQPRHFHKRWINRPRNYPTWGLLNVDGTVNTPDSWPAAIRLFGIGFSPGNLPGDQTFFYAQTYFKVIFRNRRE